MTTLKTIDALIAEFPGLKVRADLPEKDLRTAEEKRKAHRERANAARALKRQDPAVREQLRQEAKKTYERNREAVLERKRLYREKNHEELKEAARERDARVRQTDPAWAHAKRLLHPLRVAAGRRGDKLPLRMADVAALLDAKTCPMTGIEFDLSLSQRGGNPTQSPFWPALMQIDEGAGWVPGNVRCVVKAYLDAVTTLGPDVLMKIARTLTQRTSK